MMWLLVVSMSLMIAGYHSEADCQAAAKKFAGWGGEKTYCVPMDEHGVAVFRPK